LGSSGAVSIANNYPNAAVISDAHSVRRDLPLNFFMDRYTESFLVELQAFVDAVLQDRPVPVTGHDGRAAAVLALAAQRSYHAGRPVRLDEVE
jgi:myo-inositol 2-dehydrogenase/D-chiro-inositol 1-dehydrogenase